MLPVPWQMKIAALAGGARISLPSLACSGGDDSAKTAGPTATQTSSTNSGGNTSAATTTTRATATPAGAGSAGVVDACSVLTSAEISAAINETEGGALSHV